MRVWYAKYNHIAIKFDIKIKQYNQKRAEDLNRLFFKRLYS